MSHNITDVSVWTSPIGPVPDPADPAYAASVVQAIQGLANRTRLLADTRAESAELEEVRVALQDQLDAIHSITYLTRVVGGFGHPETVYSGGVEVHPGWELTAGGLWRTKSTWTGGRIFFVLDLPHGCMLANIWAHLTPATGHLGWPVAHPPAMTLYGEPGGVLASVTDVADDISYETPHNLLFVQPGYEYLDIIVDRASTRYTLAINNEYGTNSKAGGLTIGIIAAYIRPDETLGFDKGAA